MRYLILVILLLTEIVNTPTFPNEGEKNEKGNMFSVFSDVVDSFNGTSENQVC